MLRCSAILKLVAPLAIVLVNAPLTAQVSAGSDALAHPSDVESVDAIVAAVYDVISGPAGQERDWDRMRSLFVPGARLIPTFRDSTGGRGLRILTIDDWIAGANRSLPRRRPPVGRRL